MILLAAGLRGIDEGYELPPETDANLFELSDSERRNLGVEPLPRSLNEALDVIEVEGHGTLTIDTAVFGSEHSRAFVSSRVGRSRGET